MLVRLRGTSWPIRDPAARRHRRAVLAFGAIGLSNDSTGEFCRSLFQVVFLSLGLSWVTGVTVTPLLCVMFLKAPANQALATTKAIPYDGIVFVALSQVPAAGNSSSLGQRECRVGLLCPLSLGIPVCRQEFLSQLDASAIHG